MLVISHFLFYNNIKRCIIIFLEEKLFEEAAAKMIISMHKAKEDEKCQIKWRFIISVLREEQKR